MRDRSDEIAGAEGGGEPRREIVRGRRTIDRQRQHICRRRVSERARDAGERSAIAGLGIGDDARMARVRSSVAIREDERLGVRDVALDVRQDARDDRLAVERFEPLVASAEPRRGAAGEDRDGQRVGAHDDSVSACRA